ncbi:MAG: ABC transporter permease [Opitutales bacterium]|nr:ABC transporter permease [Opitutales bacterium]
MWPFFLALKQLFPPDKPLRLSAFAVVSIIGVAVGVCSLLVVQTVMNGYACEHRENIQRMYGHVVVKNPSGHAVGNYKELAQTLGDVPGVVAVSPFAEGQVMVKHGNIPSLPFVRGIDIDQEDKVVPVKKLIVAGKADDLDDDRVIVGKVLAQELGIEWDIDSEGKIFVPAGQTVEVYSPTMIDDIDEGEMPLPVELEVCGIFESGYYPADQNTIIVTLRRMQDFYHLGKRVHGLRIRIDDPERAVEYLPRINKVLPAQLRAISWLQINWNFLQAVQFEKTMLFFLMFIVTIVASFSIASTLFSAVIKRSREIGIIGALGGRPWQILGIFVFQGVVVGVIGYACGCGLTFWIVACRDNIVRFINSLFGSGDMIQTQYLFSQIPVHYSLEDFVVAGIFTIGITTLAALVPAILAARKRPAEAMRTE